MDAIDPTPGRRQVARSLGSLFMLEGVLAGIWLALPMRADAHVVWLVAICVGTFLVGAWLRRGGADRARPWVIDGLIAGGTVVAAIAYAASGDIGSGFAFFFLWTTPYAVYLGARHALAQTAFAMLMLGAAHVSLRGGDLAAVDVSEWLLPAATIAVVTSIVSELTVELGRTDRERLASERERAEAETRRATSERERAQREAATARLGRLALRASDRKLLLDEVVRQLAGTLGVEQCSILELTGDGQRLETVAGTRRAPGPAAPSGSAPPPPRDAAAEQHRAAVAAAEHHLAGYVLEGDEPVVVWEWASENRFDVPAFREHGIRSTAAAAMRGRSGAFGIIAVHSVRVGAFSAEEGQWLQSVADLLASALDRERSEAAMRYQSLHDALTGLPNRALLFDRVEHAFLRAQREDAGVAVLLLDIDQFKTINDSLGHHAGDELLIEVGSRLREVVRSSDTVARLGGDEFVVLCEVENEAEAFDVASRVGQSFERPIRLESGDVFISASVGIAVAREPQPPTKMLREADAAMYRAKSRGRGGYELFDEAMRRDAFQRLRIESDLRRALERNEFRVHYQPIFDVQTMHPIGVEALLRWHHPTRGIVGPVEFIPLAEDTGLITPLGGWVLEQAVAEVHDWRRRFPDHPLRVTVNVSAQQLARPEFLGEVLAVLERTEMEPQWLGLEITESVLMEDLSSPRSTLESLRAHGVRVLIDDFGTGYSSLSRLKGLPLDAIKVDRSFVDGLGTDDEDSAIVGAIAEIARSLNLHVIAEGVETETQLAHLRTLGCQSAQGYLFSGPLSHEQMEEFLGEEEPGRAARAALVV